jgi:hypothetical protein
MVHNPYPYYWVKRPRICYLWRSTTEHSSTCQCICFNSLLILLTWTANKMGLWKKLSSNICFCSFHVMSFHFIYNISCFIVWWTLSRLFACIELRIIWTINCCIVVQSYLNSILWQLQLNGKQCIYRRNKPKYSKICLKWTAYEMEFVLNGNISSLFFFILGWKKIFNIPH